MYEHEIVNHFEFTKKLPSLQAVTEQAVEHHGDDLAQWTFVQALVYAKHASVTYEHKREADLMLYVRFIRDNDDYRVVQYNKNL